MKTSSHRKCFPWLGGRPSGTISDFSAFGTQLRMRNRNSYSGPRHTLLFFPLCNWQSLRQHLQHYKKGKSCKFRQNLRDIQENKIYDVFLFASWFTLSKNCRKYRVLLCELTFSVDTLRFPWAIRSWLAYHNVCLSTAGPLLLNLFC